MDYTAVSHNFTYAPGADLTCFAYDALIDSVYEEKEDYCLQFVSNDPNVIINQDSRLSVIILDSTSKMVMAQNNNSIPVQVTLINENIFYALGQHTIMKSDLYQTNVKNQWFNYRVSFQYK